MSSNGSSSKGLGRREKAARFNVFGKHDEARSPKRRARGDKGPTNRYGRECRADGSRLCEITNDLLAVWTGLWDEEWDDGNEQNVLEAAEQDNETTAIKQDDEEEEEEEELQRAFSRQSEGNV
ncbi:hypothetical protein HN011_004229 [Eciton burchellii]|nr:hypothetical protein HN011_004229 [Eciton burchellii]